MEAQQPKKNESSGHYRSLRQRRGRGKAKLQPPLAPMIDVTFQLLIFFLLTATFSHEGNISYKFPPLGEAAADKSNVMATNVDVDEHGEGDNARPTYTVLADTLGKAKIEPPSYEWGRRAFNAMSDDLARALSEQRQKGGEEAHAIIRPASVAVQWRYVVEAYNQARRAGFVKVGIGYE
ncbi:MAG: biopolymer transporter ExbD [Phycisphaerae bacterium]|nr:biopolymer transporter ExbD [Phycisphaerae bacterium]